MNKLIVILSLLVTFHCYAETDVESKVEPKIIRLATLEWPPYVGKKMPSYGHIYEIVQEAFKRAGYKTEIRFYPWARVMSMAESARVDGYFPEYMNPKYDNKFAFSHEIPGGPVGLMKRSSFKGDIDTSKNDYIDELKKHKLGVVRGYTNTKLIDEASFLKKHKSVSDGANVRMLLANRVQYIFIDPNVAKYLISHEEEGLKRDYLNEIEFIQPALENKLLYTCFSKRTPNYQEKLDAFNKGLEIIKSDGTLEKILAKHKFSNGRWMLPQ